MIVIYTSPGCAGCRKLKQWLKEHDISYIEKNIFKVLLNEAEIRHFLIRSENGTDDIISKRSKILTEQDIDIDSMSVDELIAFIRNNPSVLKRPIIVNENTFQVGYDSEEIDALMPKDLGKIALKYCNSSCPNWEGCGKVRQEENQALDGICCSTDKTE